MRQLSKSELVALADAVQYFCAPDTDRCDLCGCPIVVTAAGRKLLREAGRLLKCNCCYSMIMAIAVRRYWQNLEVSDCWRAKWPTPIPNEFGSAGLGAI